VSQPGEPAPAVPAYERRFGFFGRLYRFVVSPSDAMQDVALAPDYAGALAILIVEMIFVGVAVGLVFQKFQLVGTNASQIGGFVSSVLGVAVVLSFGLIIVQWLVKSALVWASCKSGSNWSFKTAAVVTGYAYFADLVVGLVGLFLVWLLLPTYVIDTTNLTAAQQSIASLEAKLMYMRLLYSLPMTFLALLWKSYLGGSGSHYGTSKLCSIGKGFGIFLLLGLIGVLISFAS
jgi:hypothetical protein